MVWQPLSLGLAFIPHGHCYLWKPDLVGLHVVSDTLIAAAYYSIPWTLLHFVQKRQDLPFGWIFQLFGAFIIACGTTHLLEVWTLWYPNYWIAGAIKALTAGVSVTTAIVLVPLVPKALALPSPLQLEIANQDLQREIAERNQVEASLRQSEARYRAVLEDQTELICRFLPDSVFTFVNDAYCRYFGKTREELIGCSWTPVIYEEDLENVQTQLSQISVENPVTTVVNRVVCPNGEIRTHQWINRGIFSQDGKCLEFQAVGRDITDLKQAEAALQESQRFIQKIAATAPIILYVYDLHEKRSVYINREFTSLLGYSEEETQAMEQGVLQSILHPEDSTELVKQKHRWKTAQDSDLFQTECRLKHRNGEWRYFLCQETLFARDRDNLPKQVLGAAVDITDRKLSQQLQVALKEKEVLLKEIHHRVKNNLQIIYSLLRLQRRKLTDEKTVEILLESQNRIKSIALIHEKLYRSADLSQIDLRQYVPNLVTSLFSAYQVNSDWITLRMEVDDIALDIDTAVPCGLIINELVANCLKYAFSDDRVGEIFVEMHLKNQDEKQAQIELTVADNGIGVPPDFDIFQSQSLGLKLVKDLVHQLEGTIDISVVEGIQFKIVFPWRKAC